MRYAPSKAGALDYLLKPFDKARFELALTRAKSLLEGCTPATRLERVAIKTAGELHFIRISDIDWIEGADYYACLHVASKNHLLRRTLAELEQDLDPTEFCRVHRSSIVNLRRVLTLRLNENGEHEVTLDDGDRVRLSRRYRKILEARMAATREACRRSFETKVK